jgi:hypothetical protein
VLDARTYVPLKEMAPYLGADVSFSADLTQATLRWGISQTLTTSDLYLRVGIVYMELDRLARLLGARLQSLDGHIYLYTTPAELKILSGIGDQLSFVFSHYAPYRIEPQGAHLRLVFYNAISHQALPTLASRRIRSVQGQAEAPTRFVVTVELDSAAPYQTSAFTTLSGFSLWIRFGANPAPSRLGPISYPEQPVSATRLDRHTTLYQSRVLTPAGIVLISYLKIQDYRNNYWLQVGLPPAGLGTLSALSEITRAHGAFAAINANFFDPQSGHPIGLLVKDSFPISSPYGQRAVMLIDFLDRISFGKPTLQLSFRAFGRTVTIEDVNRPLKRDKLVLYTSDYGRAIRAGLPLRAVQVRRERVVRVWDGTAASNEPGSMLLVASGSARSRLAGLRPGDELTITYRLRPQPEFLSKAISAGPLLLQAGELVLNPGAEAFTAEFARAKTARSAIGLTADGDLLWLVALRGNGSVGCDFATLAQIMSQLGALDAMALDGGSSSGIAYHRGLALEVVGSDRPIAAALLLLAKKK